MSRVEAAIFAAEKPVSREQLSHVVGKACQLELVIDDIRDELRGRPPATAAFSGSPAPATACCTLIEGSPDQIFAPSFPPRPSSRLGGSALIVASKTRERESPGFYLSGSSWRYCSRLAAIEDRHASRVRSATRPASPRARLARRHNWIATRRFLTPARPRWRNRSRPRSRFRPYSDQQCVLSVPLPSAPNQLC